MPNKTPENPNEKKMFRKITGGILLPLAFFPFMALISYDWRDIPDLCIRNPEPSRNLIGPLGNMFAYYGYELVGLAVWVVPVVCIILGLRLMLAPAQKLIRRLNLIWWSSVAFLSLVSILQLFSNVPLISEMLESVNIAPNAGGAIGYLFMTCFLASIVSPFGALVIMLITLGFSLFFIIGVKRIIKIISGIFSWVTDRSSGGDDGYNFDDDGATTETEAIPATTAKPPKSGERPLPRAPAAQDRLPSEIFRNEKKRQEKPKAPQEIKGSFQPDLFDDFSEEDSWLANSRQIGSGEITSIAPAVQTPADMFRSEPPQAPIFTPPAEKPAKPVTKPSVKKSKPIPPSPPPASSEADDGTEKEYVLPPTDILSPIPPSSAVHGNVEEMKQRLIENLRIFGVDATIAYTVAGPVVTQYAVQPAPGVKYSTITSLSTTLQGALEAKSLRVIAPIPGKNAVGFEVPNLTAASVSFREIIESEFWQSTSYWPEEGQPKFHVPLLLGKDAAGNDLVVDLAKIPHLLVAGATGQGKSVCLNSIINGLLMCRTPDQLRMIMVDPKRVEFTSYNKLPHLLIPVVNDTNKVVFALRWAVNEMTRRLNLFAKTACRNIVDFNSRKKVMQPSLPGMGGGDEILGNEKDGIPSTLPYIVIVIDELADIMQSNQSKDVESVLARLLALARATGIHLILATQRPDTKVITGTLKSNIPGRIAFKTSQGNDSRTIIDSVGAEQLIGKGDMLFKTSEGALLRAQGAFISDGDINSIIDFISTRCVQKFDEKLMRGINKVKEAAEEEEEAFRDDGDSDGMEDEALAAAKKAEKKDKLYYQALATIASTRRASTSHLQRCLEIGYNNAAKIIDMIEANGIIGPQRAAGSRELLVDPDEILKMVRDFENAGSEDEDETLHCHGGDSDIPASEGDGYATEDSGETTESKDGTSDGFSETGGVF